MGALQGFKPLQVEHQAAAGGAARQHPARIPAAEGEPAPGSMKATHLGGRAWRCSKPRVRRVGTGLRYNSLDPPPWPGDRGEVRLPLPQGRTWRNAACILLKLRSHLQQWKVLCDDAQAMLLRRCILLLDKRHGELMRIAWR